MCSYRIENRKLTVSEYQNLRNTTTWDCIEDHVVEAALEKDLFKVIVYDEDELVGMGRVVGDGAIYFYIQDIIVKPEYQGKGVGRIIMMQIEKFLRDNTNNNSFIGLMAAEGVVEFYHKFGYQERPQNKPGMFKVKKS